MKSNIYQKVARSLSELGHVRDSNRSLAKRFTWFLVQEARTMRATTKPTLPVELVLLKGCILSREQMTQLVHGWNDPVS